MDESYIVCPICNYRNAPNAKLCLKCQSVLQLETRKIEQDNDLVGTPKWGSKTTGRKLYLHIHGSNESLEIELSDGVKVFMGRYDARAGIKPEIDLSNYGAAQKGVSRQHAQLVYENESLKILDQDSSNFTYLNGQRLPPHQARILRDGDEIRLGALMIIVQFD